MTQREFDVISDAQFHERAELVIWSVGCIVGILTGIMLIAHGYVNVGSENAYAAVVVIFGILLIGFCAALMRRKIAEFSKKFGVADDALDTKIVEFERKRFAKQLAEAVLQKGVAHGQTRIG